MVTKGQFLERPTLIPSAQNIVLEGISHRGTQRPLLLVLPPPPAEGGGMDHVVSAELVFAAAQAGHPTLRFNYRGVGASQGKRDSTTPKTLLQDAVAAYGLAVDNAAGGTPVIATLGSSDAVAWQLAKDYPLAGLLLINPSLLTPEDIEHAPFPIAVVMAEHDETQRRGDWATVLQTRGEALAVVPGADKAYQRNLLMVGKAGAAFLAKAAQRLELF